MRYVWERMRRVFPLMCVLFLAHGGARAEEASELQSSFLDEDRGWPAGSIQRQLDADPTLVPFGKGAIFVPAMTNPLDEPPVAVWRGGQKVAEGTTGQRIVLNPGTYEVQIGTGAREQRLSVQATVKELNTTVLPPAWAGLAVHVVDEQYGSLRGSYEIIRVEDREYIGIGFGTDEQAGEPVTTWILRPGLYKVVRVGDTYRARRDFATVRLLEGQLTHFLLVVNEETGEFAGGGEIPEEDLFGFNQEFFGRLVIGGDFTVNRRENVLGFADGWSFAFRAFVDGRMSIRLLDSPLVLQVQIEEGQAKQPELEWQKSDDRADFDGLYVYRWLSWIGPYARLGAETNLLPGNTLFEEPQDVVLLDTNEVVKRRMEDVSALRLSPSFGLSTVKEGLGLNVRLFKTVFAETNVRTGLGARHVIARELFEERDRGDTPEIEFMEIQSRHLAGVEGTVLAVARLTRWVLINAELDSLLPFDAPSDPVFELEGSIALKLTSFLSVNYVLRFLRDRALFPDDKLQQDLLLRFSLEVF